MFINNLLIFYHYFVSYFLFSFRSFRKLYKAFLVPFDHPVLFTLQIVNKINKIIIENCFLSLPQHRKKLCFEN